MKLQPIFKIRVVYKSGYTHDFEVTAFSFDGSRYKWVSYDDKNKPIDLGASEVAAAWKIGHRYVLRFSKGT